MEETLKDKYNRLLREGRVAEATQLVSGEESESFDFTELDGVGPSLADDLNTVFSGLSDLQDASVDRLTDVDGVGVKTAEDLKNQVNNFK